jgi:hypothetical protein
MRVVWDTLCRGTREVTDVLRELCIMDMSVPSKAHYAIFGLEKGCF